MLILIVGHTFHDTDPIGKAVSGLYPHDNVVCVYREVDFWKRLEDGPGIIMSTGWLRHRKGNVQAPFDFPAPKTEATKRGIPFVDLSRRAKYLVVNPGNAVMRLRRELR